METMVKRRTFPPNAQARAGSGHVSPEAEDAYWRTNFMSRGYVTAGDNYEMYQPAYRYGLECYLKYKGRNFNLIEEGLESGWNSMRGESALPWKRAVNASRDAYDRLVKRFGAIES